MSNGDGQHNAPPSFSPRMTPEMIAEIVGALMPVIRDEIRRSQRPVQAQAEYIAHLYGISAKTVHRRCHDLGIPRRDMHGRPKKESSGPTYYSLDEWEGASALPTRSITNRLKKQRRGRDINPG